MGTVWCEGHIFGRVFKGRRERSGPRGAAGLCRPLDPISGQTDSRVAGRQEEKRTLPRAPVGVPAVSCVAA